jgi:hypothetical protein
MSEAAQRCTKCLETKPLTAFSLRKAGDPNGPRRSQCKACNVAYSKHYRKEGKSVFSELVAKGSDNYEALSPEARKAVYTTAPIDPAIIAACIARSKKREARERRVARKLERELAQGLRPMRFSRQDTFA